MSRGNHLRCSLAGFSTLPFSKAARNVLLECNINIWFNWKVQLAAEQSDVNVGVALAVDISGEERRWFLFGL